MGISNHKINIKKYHAIHHWLKINYGKADKCENKKCPHISKHYSWSLKKDCHYDYNRNVFQMLCRSCHAKQDISDTGRTKLSIINSVPHYKKDSINCLVCKILITKPNPNQKYCHNCAIKVVRDYKKIFNRNRYLRGKN